MSNLDFPDPPTPGQIHPDPALPGVPQFIYDAVKDAWDKIPLSVYTPSLQASPSEIVTGDSVTVSWIYIPEPLTTDVIQAHYFEAEDVDNPLLEQNADGLSESNIVFNNITVSTGTLVFYYRRGNKTLAISNIVSLDQIVVPTLTATPTEINLGESITVTWSDISNPSSTDWILFINPGVTNQYYEKRLSATGNANDSITFYNIARSWTKEFRYVRGSSTLAVSNSVYINPALILELTVSDTEIYQGESITVSWSNIPNPTNTDYIGLYLTSYTEQEPQVYITTNGQASGSVTFSNIQIPSVGQHVFHYKKGGLSYGTSVAVSPTINILLRPTLFHNAGPEYNGNSTIYEGQSPSLLWSGIENPQTTDIIAAYRQGEANQLTYLQASGSTPGSVTFNSFSHIGSIIFRYLKADSSLIAESDTLTVLELSPPPPSSDPPSSDPPPPSTSGELVWVSNVPSGAGPDTQAAYPAGSWFYTVTVNFKYSLSGSTSWVASYTTSYFDLESSPFESVYITPGFGTVTSSGTSIIISYQKAQADWRPSKPSPYGVIRLHVEDTVGHSFFESFHHVKPWVNNIGG